VLWKLALLSLPENLFSCSVIPPLENSTYNVHSGIHLKMRTRPVRAKRLSRRTVWRYTHANFEKANRLIESLDMSSILNPNDIDRSWENWRAEFLHIMDKCVPKPPFPIGVTYHGYSKVLSTQFGNETTITEWLGNWQARA